ncbi:NADPH-dependent glutamate synthase [Oceanispirochaeta crateris]|uniref:NADPH-dependent glutamate synthase n=1 Tax=Oceanispirochaeta crateris TaxID=2518645 RepID=A0A5C1QP39_9SPIO|nr:NADPH-dependent glutamate synthase [Oceanispirochaeta crateris]QEN08760.1 NADPH-dependent glutamate synthase [Oceanispirochaeta crateris]
MTEYREPALLSREADDIKDRLNLPEGLHDLKAKERAAIPQQEMPAQEARIRAHNMDEVALGYTESQVIVEASRCLGCKNAPCVAGCPVGINIPGFIAAAAQYKFDEALQIIQESSILPAICGRVCPQEKQCMQLCTLGKIKKDPLQSVAIGRIERFLADHGSSHSTLDSKQPSTGKKVAIVGSGPSGLTTAADLARLGHDVTIFEAFHKAGGVTVYGIPEFRLPKSIVSREVENLEALGVKIIYDYLIGRTRTIKELMEKDGYDSVYVANGAGLPKFMNIEGENLVGVFSANEYLTRTNLMKAYDRDNAATPLYSSKKVAVFGGGNVAMDAARTALRMGAEEVHIVYRRTEAEMPARKEEVLHAREEGIIFDLLTNPSRILGDENGRVRGIECLKYKLGIPDESGRARPEVIEGSEFQMEIDTCITALGNSSNPLVTGTTPELEVNKWGNIIVDENGMTSMKGVFAGGDIVQGAATVILAMGDGRIAARGIHQYLSNEAQPL